MNPTILVEKVSSQVPKIVELKAGYPALAPFLPMRIGRRLGSERFSIHHSAMDPTGITIFASTRRRQTLRSGQNELPSV